jgi:hypothetical protein
VAASRPAKSPRICDTGITAAECLASMADSF